MLTITPHIVVSDAGRAADWYRDVFAAEERGRLEVPGGKLMQVDLWFGDTAVMHADEFPETGVLSPLSIGGTATVLHFSTDDATPSGSAPSTAPRCASRSRTSSGGRYGQITDPFGHRWGIAQRLRDVPREELIGAVSEVFGGA